MVREAMEKGSGVFSYLDLPRWMNSAGDSAGSSA